MDIEDFVTGCFRKRLGVDLIAVLATPMAGTMHVLVKVRGRLPEAEAVAVDLMAELAELDRTLHIVVEAAGDQ